MAGGLRGGRVGEAGRRVVAVQGAAVAGDAGGCCGDAVPGGQDGGGGLGARVGAGPAGGVEAGSPAGVMPWRAQVMKATESASALRSPVQPEVVVPGGGRSGSWCSRTWPSWCASAQTACSSLVSCGRDADAAGGPEDGAVSRGAVLLLDRESRGGPASTARPARPGGAWPAGAAAAAEAGGCPVVWDRSQT